MTAQQKYIELLFHTLRSCVSSTPFNDSNYLDDIYNIPNITTPDKVTCDCYTQIYILFNALPLVCCRFAIAGIQCKLHSCSESTFFFKIRDIIILILEASVYNLVSPAKKSNIVVFFHNNLREVINTQKKQQWHQSRTLWNARFYY